MNAFALSIHGTGKSQPEDIVIDYSAERVFRYKKCAEYSDPVLYDQIACWYFENCLVEETEFTGYEIYNGDII